MNIGLSALNDIGSNYYMRLNDKEILIVEEDPISKSQNEAKKNSNEKKQEEEKAQESKKSSNPDELNEGEKRLVKDLASRDREVKAHEAAHQAAGGGMTGPASYTYQQGPDGKMYAIGGEVSISIPGSSNPEEAIKNARQVAAAAMAAGSPSPQDFSVAASARVMEMKAQQQLAKEQLDKTAGLDTYKNAANSLQNDSQKEQTPKFDLPA